MADSYKIQLEDVFEGPMDLLLHLIKKNEVDIYDIPIALITRQYLEYLERMKAIQIEFAGDFIVMAATLAQIKSRMLLPAYDGQEDEDEDPRNAISRPLIEYLQMKTVANRQTDAMEPQAGHTRRPRRKRRGGDDGRTSAKQAAQAPRTRRKRRQARRSSWSALRGAQPR